MGFDHWLKRVFQAFLLLGFAAMGGIILYAPLQTISNCHYAACAMQ